MQFETWLERYVLTMCYLCIYIHVMYSRFHIYIHVIYTLHDDNFNIAIIHVGINDLLNNSSE